MCGVSHTQLQHVILLMLHILYIIRLGQKKIYAIKLAFFPLLTIYYLAAKYGLNQPSAVLLIQISYPSLCKRM